MKKKSICHLEMIVSAGFVLFSVVVFSVRCALAVEKKIFKRISNITETAPSCRLWSVPVISKLSCSRLCASDDRCVLFKYVTTGTCSLFCGVGADIDINEDVFVYRAVCPEPPSLLNGNVVFTTLWANDIANYSCNNYYRFVGSSQQSVCHVTGSWLGLNGSCKRFGFFNPTLPFEGKIPGILAPGWKVEILGTPLDEPRMTVNFNYLTDYLALHFDVRFDYSTEVNVVLRQTHTPSGWGIRETDSDPFPFTKGQHFNLTFLISPSQFDIFVDDALFTSRAHYVNYTEVESVSILRGADIDSVRFLF